MNAIQLLTNDHNTVRELFKKFNGGEGLAGVVRRTMGSVSPAERRTAVQEVCRELEIHTAIEEEAFYPAVRALEDRELVKMVNEALKEHEAVKREVSGLRAASGDEDELDERMAQLEKDVEHHATEEEDEMFPRLEDLMSEGQLEDLGRRLAGLKQAAMKAAPSDAGRRGVRAAEQPAKTRGAARGGSSRR
jgi:hemerythrin superfamily protein